MPMENRRHAPPIARDPTRLRTVGMLAILSDQAVSRSKQDAKALRADSGATAA